jgi:hypothetical protein
LRSGDLPRVVGGDELVGPGLREGFEVFVAVRVPLLDEAAEVAEDGLIEVHSREVGLPARGSDGEPSGPVASQASSTIRSWWKPLPWTERRSEHSPLGYAPPTRQ